MITSFIPKSYEEDNPLPTYVTDLRKYILIGTTMGRYKITLAKLTVSNSVSAGNSLTHALFESYSDHGEQIRA